eukprot:m.398936 g.398936  ORF g.398936 m.398936 type:complete len:119 (-) comp16779_c0_seq1:415-771(-)
MRRAALPLERLVKRAGYLGKPKGVKQVLWERGLWKEGMNLIVKADNPKGYEVGGEYCATTVLNNCADFAKERGQLRKLIESCGHIMLESPIGHPEIAGKSLYSAHDTVLHLRAVVGGG